MKRSIKLLVVTQIIFSLAQTMAWGTSIPLMIPHRGTVNVDGIPFNGPGLFKFAIINGHTDCNPDTLGPECVTFWSNDNSSSQGSAPDNAIKIDVSAGNFSIKLGDSSLLNTDEATPMPQVLSTVFDASETYLRVWFDDGVNGLQVLSPDRQLLSVPYAYKAEKVASIFSRDTSNVIDQVFTGVEQQNILLGTTTGTPTGLTLEIDTSGLAATRLLIFFNAECTVGAPNNNTWLNISILVDGAGISPSNNDNAFCTSRGDSSISNGWVSASTNGATTVTPGPHSIQVNGQLSSNASATDQWRIDDLSLIVIGIGE